jgi:hypothetical protein
MEVPTLKTHAFFPTRAGRPWCRTSTIGVGLVVALASACSEERPVPIEVAEWTITDSGGVEVVGVSGLGLDGRNHVERLERVQSSAREWGDITAGGFLADGTIAAIDRLEGQVVFLSRQLDVQQVYGRRGKGPEEFSRLERLWDLRSDTVVVFDSGNQRLSWITAEGETVRQDAMRGSQVSQVLAVTPGGYWIGRREEVPPGPGTRRRQWFVTPATEEGEQPESAVAFEGDEYALLARDGRLLVNAVPFARGARFGAAEATIAFAHGGSDEIQFWNAVTMELQSVFRPQFPPKAVEEVDIEEWVRRASGGIPRTSSAFRRIEEAQRELLTYDSYPFMDGLMVEAEREVWLRRPDLLSSDELWWGFDLADQSFRVVSIPGTLLGVSDQIFLVREESVSGAPVLSLFRRMPVGD